MHINLISVKNPDRTSRICTLNLTAAPLHVPCKGNNSLHLQCIAYLDVLKYDKILEDAFLEDDGKCSEMIL